MIYGACMHCGAELRRGVYRMAHRTAVLVYCPHCGSIHEQEEV